MTSEEADGKGAGRESCDLKKKVDYQTCLRLTFSTLTGESRWVEGTHYRRAVSSKISHAPALSFSYAPKSSPASLVTERQTVTGSRTHDTSPLGNL